MHKEQEQKQSSFRERFRRKLRTDRRFVGLLYASVALLAVLFYVAGWQSDRTARDRDTVTAEHGADASVTTEQRLMQVLSCIRGAGKVEVMITYETGKEIVTAMTTNTNTSSSESRSGTDASLTSQVNETSQPATRSGEDGSEPIVLYEKEPVIRGVIVVAEGAADVAVRLDLQRAVCAVLDVPISSVEVFEGRGDDAVEKFPQS